MSQISARRDADSHAAQDHWISEQVFDWSGIPSTHIRPTFFADWLVYPHFANEIWQRKSVEFPYGEGRHAPIGSNDQGRVIAYLLAAPEKHAGKVYKLHGPVEMNHYDIAEIMSKVLGTKITYNPISIPEFKRRMEVDYKFNPFLVQHLVEVAQDYQNGIFAGTNNAIEEITGERAMTVEEFISANRVAYV